MNTMNRMTIIVLLCLFALGIQAQQTNTVFGDSANRIQLPDILVQAAKSNQQKKLIDFFLYNKMHTTEELLSNLPEINIIRRGSYGMEPLIRGFTSGQTQILLDGMRIQGACTDKMDPASIYAEAQQLSGIRTETGGAAHLAGSAPGGLIQFALKAPLCHTAQPLSFSVSSGYQSAAQALLQSASMHFTKDLWAVRVNGSYRRSNAYRAGGGKAIPYSEVEKMNSGISVLKEGSKSRTWKADVLWDYSWRIGYPALPMDVAPAKAWIAALSFFEGPSANWHKKEWKLYANSVMHWMDDTRRSNIPMHMDMPGRSSTIGTYAEGHLKLKAQELCKIRVDATMVDLNASMTMYPYNSSPMFMYTWPPNRELQAGTGIQYERSFKNHRTIGLVGRADIKSFSLKSQAAKDQLAVMNMSLTPKISLLKNLEFRWQEILCKPIKLQVKIGYGERAPNATEYYGFYLFNRQDGYDYIGNTNLHKERFLNGDMSLLVDQKRIQFKGTLFYAYTYDLIRGRINTNMSIMTPGAHGVKVFQNTPHGIQYGVEAYALLKCFEKDQFVLNLRSIRGSDNRGNPLPQLQPSKAIITYRKNWKQCYIEPEFVVSQTQERFAIDYGEQRTPGFSLFHFRSGIQYRWGSRILDFQAGVENIFDKQYREHTDWGGIPRLGRNGYMSVTLQW